MAIPNQTDKVKDTKALAEDAGQNAPLTPMGAQELGATPKQSDMMGTPAQLKANIQMQEAEQEARLQRQEKEASAEQARLGGQLLSQQERYVEPTPTQQQEQAGQIAETMRVLGPVQSRVQGLIQARLSTAQTKAAETIIDIDAARQWLVDNDAQIPNDVNLSELLAGVKDAKDQATYEAALQKVYDVLYPDGNIPEGFDTAIQSFFKTTEESIEETISPEITAGGATLGSIDLGLMGITDDQKGEIADALGLSVEAFDNLTLDELNKQIESLEADELSRVEELRNMLDDPTISFAMKKAIYDELRQLGAAGVVGAEQEIQTLQEQIDTANTIEILGETYTLEEALSDDGLSELIARAASDEKLLQAMKDTPGYQALAQWVETNKTAVQSLLDEYEFQAKSFVEVQREYKDFREILGVDDAAMDVMKAIAGVEAFSNSMTSEQFELFKNKIEGSSLFKVLYDTDAKKIRGGYQKFLADLKADKDLLAQFTQRDEEGNLVYSEEAVKNTVALKEAFDSEGDYFSLLYGGLDGYVSFEDYSDLKTEGGKLYVLDKWKNNVSSEVKVGITALQDVAVRAGKTEKGEAFLDVDDLVKVSSAKDPEEVMDDLTTWAQKSSSLSKTYKDNYGKIKTDILGAEDFDAKDIAAYFNTKEGQKNKQAILDIFDTSGDDIVQQSEIDNQDEETLKALLKYLGLDKGKDDVIDAAGGWEAKETPVFGIGANLHEAEVLEKAEAKNEEINSTFDGKRSDVVNKYGWDAANSANANNVVNSFNLAIANADATLSERRDQYSSILNNLVSGYEANDSLRNLRSSINKAVELQSVTKQSGEAKAAKAALDSMFSGLALPESTKQTFNNLLQNGIPKAEVKNGKVDYSNVRRAIDAVNVIRNNYSIINKNMTNLIGLLLRNKKGAEMTRRSLEAHRGNLDRELLYLNNLANQLERNSGFGQADKYNKFVDEFSAVQNEQDAYTAWWKKFSKATPGDNFNTLESQGRERGWI